MDRHYSALNLNARRLGFFGLSSVVTVLVFWFTLWFLHQPYAATPEFYVNRFELFWRFGALFAIVVPISTIFLFRGELTDGYPFSKLGRLALAWPLIPFLVLLLAPIVALAPAFRGISLVGGALGVITLVRSIVTKRYWGDGVAIPLNIVWLWVSYAYSQEWWLVYGD
jgi:hypothetical protein